MRLTFSKTRVKCNDGGVFVHEVWFVRINSSFCNKRVEIVDKLQINTNSNSSAAAILGIPAT